MSAVRVRKMKWEWAVRRIQEFEIVRVARVISYHDRITWNVGKLSELFP